MQASVGVSRRGIRSRCGAAGLALSLLIPSAPAPAQTPQIVEPTGNPKPQYSKATDPSPRDLIETWRSLNANMDEKRVDKEKFEIVAYRVVPGKYPKAFLRFRIFSAEADPLAWAAARCHGRDTPVELQIYFSWSQYLEAWVPLGARGEGDNDLCAKQRPWTADQIEDIVNPKPLPVPPKVTLAEVVTPTAGSPERAAIMDALRPTYESLLGAPIVFRVDKLRVAAGFAWVVVHPQRPNGAPVAQQTWAKAFAGQCFQDPRGVTNEYWMKKDGGVWTIGRKNDMCADDSILDEGDLIGAPPQLVDKPAWPEREDRPLPD